MPEEKVEEVPEVAKQTKSKSRGKKKKNTFLLDERGLIKDVKYIFKENGLIDWRKMVNPESLYPNIEITGDGEIDISKLKDEELLIDLKGLRDLAQLRGYSTCRYNVNACDEKHVSVTCEMVWNGNFETRNRDVWFSSMASANTNNTEGFAKNFLTSIAENRAFGRCVRNFLNINIVSKEELKKTNSVDVPEESIQDAQKDPRKVLLDVMEQKKVNLTKLKKILVRTGLVEAQDYDTIKDIPDPTVFEIIGILKDYNEK